MFVVQKDDGIIPKILTQILDSCVNGVTLADPDQPDAPIIYANKAFESMTGYGQDDIIGRNCRFLQGDDRDQEGLAPLRIRSMTWIAAPASISEWPFTTARIPLTRAVSSICLRT